MLTASDYEELAIEFSDPEYWDRAAQMYYEAGDPQKAADCWASMEDARIFQSEEK